MARRHLADEGCAVQCKEWIDFAQIAFWSAGAFAFVVAGVGGIAGWRKYWRELKGREWDRAHSAYERFLDVAIENPEFVPGYWSQRERTPEERNKYRWFMAHFLWAAEQALLRVPERREEWEQAIRVMLREHADFLTSPETADEVLCYYGRLRTLIDEIRAEVRAGSSAPA